MQLSWWICNVMTLATRWSPPMEAALAPSHPLLKGFYFFFWCVTIVMRYLQHRIVFKNVGQHCVPVFKRLSRFFPRIFIFSKKKKKIVVEFLIALFLIEHAIKTVISFAYWNCPLERFQFLISLTKQANTIFYSQSHHHPPQPWAPLSRFPRPGAGPGICFCQSDMKIWHIHVKKHGVQDSWFPLLSCHGEIQISDELIPWSPDTSTNFINSFYFFSPFILSPAEVCLQGV